MAWYSFCYSISYFCLYLIIFSVFDFDRWRKLMQRLLFTLILFSVGLEYFHDRNWLSLLISLNLRFLVHVKAVSLSVLNGLLMRLFILSVGKAKMWVQLLDLFENLMFIKPCTISLSSLWCLLTDFQVDVAYVELRLTPAAVKGVENLNGSSCTWLGAI